MKRVFWYCAGFLALLGLANCGSAETEAVPAVAESEAAESVEESAPDDIGVTTSAPTTSTSTTSAPPPTTEAHPPEDPDILVLQAHIDAFNAADVEALAATFDDEYAASPFIPPMSRLGWEVWWSHYDNEGELIDCWREDEFVNCEHTFTNGVPRKVGLTNNMVQRARVENGGIVSLEEQHILAAWWSRFFAWIAQNHPDEVACGADSEFAGGTGLEEGDYPDTWDIGIPPREWALECYEFQLSVVEDYVADADYVPPAEADTTG